MGATAPDAASSVGTALPGPDPAASPTPPVTSPLPKERAMAKVGDAVPSIRVRDQNGRDRSLDEFRGKRVVLWWFPKADTPG